MNPNTKLSMKKPAPKKPEEKAPASRAHVIVSTKTQRTKDVDAPVVLPISLTTATVKTIDI